MSSGLSSTSSMFIGLTMVVLSFSHGQRDNIKPEILDFIDDIKIFFKVFRFVNITVRIIAIGFNNVLLKTRRGQNDDGDRLEIKVHLDLRENIMTAFLR